MIKYLTNYFSYRYLLFFFSFIAGWPCVFYLMGWLPNYKINYIVLLFLVFVYAGVKSYFTCPSKVKYIMIIQVLTWLVYAAIHTDTSYLTRIVFLANVFLLICISYNSAPLGLVRLFRDWVTIQVVMGTIGFILVSIGILTPISTFLEMDSRTGYFFGLFTTNTYLGGYLRNAGFFDEPGALACWGGFALLINKLYFDNKKIEILLLVGLITTTSLAYFIQVFFYFLFFYKKRKKYLIGITAVFLLIMIVMATWSTEYYDQIFGRMNYNTQTGTITGDSREGLSERTFNVFMSSPFIGIGASNLASLGDKIGFVGANPFTFFAEDGIIGQLVAWLPLLFLLGFRKYDPKYTYTVIILFLGFLQRPYDSTQFLFPMVCYAMLSASYYTLKFNKLRKSR